MSLVVYCLITLTILVFFHELGHYLAARFCGVKVLSFSIGFGKKLLSYKNKKGTVFSIALIPFGGYVRMLGEDDEDFKEKDKKLAFSYKTKLQRLFIVTAGPAFNFIFAFFALWLMYQVGIYNVTPIIGKVIKDTPAAKTSLKPMDTILSINRVPVYDWRDVEMQLSTRVGTTKPLILELENAISQEKKKISITNWSMPDDGSLLTHFGLKPYAPKIATIIGEVMNDSPAKNAGLSVGDSIIEVNGQKVNRWQEMTTLMSQSESGQLQLRIKRNDKEITIPVKLVKKTNGNGWYLGIKSQIPNTPKDWIKLNHYSFLEAIPLASQEMAKLSYLSVVMLGKLLSGKISVKHISGPIGIAVGADNSMRAGFAYYLLFLAIISIGLGILNLLPLPILDGGQAAFILYEGLFGKKISANIRQKALMISMVLLLMLTGVAIKNDIDRFWQRVTLN